MDCYKIIWKTSAKKDLKKLDKAIIPKILHRIDELTTNPYPSGSKKLIGSPSSYRLRIGEYRVIYTIKSAHLIIEIIKVGHRQRVYQ